MTPEGAGARKPNPAESPVQPEVPAQAAEPQRISPGVGFAYFLSLGVKVPLSVLIPGTHGLV